MHEHMEILPKYMLKCHMGPTQKQKNTMEHSPIKKKKIDKKKKISQPLSKITQP